MVLPLTLAILVLALLIGLLLYALWKMLGEMTTMRGEMRDTQETAMSAMRGMADAATRNSELAAKNLPKQTDAMISSLASAVRDVSTAVSASVSAVYAPAMAQKVEDANQQNDLPTPWYAHPGSNDFSDPTDGLVNEGMTDPSVGAAAGNLIIDGDDEPFGIPGLKVGM